MLTVFFVTLVVSFGYMYIIDEMEHIEDDEREEERLFEEGLTKEQVFDESTDLTINPQRSAVVRNMFGHHNATCCSVKKNDQ